jgi:PleD family two-component response regulator
MGTELSAGRVLVVDDDRVNRMLLTRSLEREGHWVRCAENCAEALELLHDDPCDVVLRRTRAGSRKADRCSTGGRPESRHRSSARPSPSCPMIS